MDRSQLRVGLPHESPPYRPVTVHLFYHRLATGISTLYYNDLTIDPTGDDICERPRNIPV